MKKIRYLPDSLTIFGLFTWQPRLFHLLSSYFCKFAFQIPLYEAVGKYVIYRNVLKITQPDRTLYMATPKGIYERYFEEPVLKKAMEEENFKLIIYNPKNGTISKWIK